MNVVEYKEIEILMRQWGERVPQQRNNIEIFLDLIRQKSFIIKEGV